MIKKLILSSEGSVDDIGSVIWEPMQSEKIIAPMSALIIKNFSGIRTPHPLYI